MYFSAVLSVFLKSISLLYTVDTEELVGLTLFKVRYNMVGSLKGMLLLFVHCSAEWKEMLLNGCCCIISYKVGSIQCEFTYVSVVTRLQKMWLNTVLCFDSNKSASVRNTDSTENTILTLSVQCFSPAVICLEMPPVSPSPPFQNKT